MINISKKDAFIIGAIVSLIISLILGIIVSNILGAFFAAKNIIIAPFSIYIRILPFIYILIEIINIVYIVFISYKSKK